MPRSAARLVLVSLALTAAACAGGSTPAAPTASTGPAVGAGSGSATSTIANFGGTWVSGSAGAGGALAGAADACSQLEYKLTPSADNRSGTVTFNATCVGITAQGSGSGVLTGDVLGWNARGTASRSGLSCDFSFDNSTAALEGSGVRVTYRGTVCGLPVSGSELLRRP
jgi:hypothetical protein